VIIDETVEIGTIILYDNDEIPNFLSKLNNEDNYAVNILFVPEFFLSTSIDLPKLSISKPILINRLSSATTLSKFIDERLDIMIDYYFTDDTILQKTMDGPGLILYY
jgi:hypothetical protein